MRIILNEKNICDEYLNTKIGVEALALKNHVGKKRIKEILNNNGINIKSRGGQRNVDSFIIENHKIEKYINTDEYHYVVVDNNTDFISKDLLNKAGILTTYIKNQYNVEIPSLYDRQKYYKRTGNYWWEQYLTYVKIPNHQTKKCPYCDWETVDIENKSGAFEQHLLKVHNKNKKDYIKEYPSDKSYFTLVNKQLNRQMEDDEKKFVTCKICGRKLARIDTHHLKIHNISKIEYINHYGNDKLYSDEYHNKQSIISTKNNMNMTFTKQSKDELEIKSFIEKTGLQCITDRKILFGKEIDIFIPSLNIGIEYNGNMWHGEKSGKDKNYHLNKLVECNKHNVKLIQIFEDEYHEHKDIVLSKIKHILNQNNDLKKVYARKCSIKEITKNESEIFLNRNHIQGFANSTLYIGAFYEKELVGVMTFIKESSTVWNLNRFACDIKVHCIGIGGKLFKYFIEQYNPCIIKSFADRRWTMDGNNNLYTKLGFILTDIQKPDYRYYNSKIDRFKRFHKFAFRKQILHKKYGLPLTMTENEMTKQLGYDKIWDCGLFKYVYTNPNYKE